MVGTTWLHPNPNPNPNPNPSPKPSQVGYRGYRMVRATHGVSSGSWYFEVRVNTPLNGEDGHTRLGWCAAPLHE